MLPDRTTSPRVYVWRDLGHPAMVARRRRFVVRVISLSVLVVVLGLLLLVWPGVEVLFVISRVRWFLSL